ncbi:MAG TPA: protein translocase subunit SecD, partial [Methylococcales bacterium]|nr:protein translocase subunit SecD [Methylococcales bacterium]
MQNSFPLWKNLFIVLILGLGLLYALPNIYGDDPSVQISSTRSTQLNEDQRDLIEKTLSAQGITAKAIEFSGDRILVRLENLDDQIKAADYLKVAFGRGFTTALNLAPATPAWLRAIAAEPMYLGLDLRGGVHFLLEVDMDAAVKQAEERYVGDIRGALRAEKIRYASIAKVN